jgi:hypothetical protein
MSTIGGAFHTSRFIRPVGVQVQAQAQAQAQALGVLRGQHETQLQQLLVERSQRLSHHQQSVAEAERLRSPSGLARPTPVTRQADSKEGARPGTNTGAGEDNGTGQIQKRREISVTSHHERSHYLHPPPYHHGVCFVFGAAESVVCARCQQLLSGREGGGCAGLQRRSRRGSRRTRGARRCRHGRRRPTRS